MKNKPLMFYVDKKLKEEDYLPYLKKEAKNNRNQENHKRSNLREKKINKKLAFLAAIFMFISINVFVATATKTYKEFSGASSNYKKNTNIEILKNTFANKIKEEPLHLKTPSSVKGIYISSWIAGTPSRREEILKFIQKSEINSVMIDVKDYSGKVFIKTDNSKITSAGSLENRIPDLPNFIKELHKKNIYTIARISVFQDDYLAKKNPRLAIKNKQGGVWEDNKGVSWLDPSNKGNWDYTIEIAKEAEKNGFDELSFDYIRFPSDGNLSNTKYSSWTPDSPKSEVIKSFFAYLRQNLNRTKIPLSGNIFGLTLWRKDDLNIGQVLENAAPYFDYLNPMVYPSHYPAGFNGYKNPAEHPYEIISDGMKRAMERLTAATSSPTKLRPWIQDFNIGATYNISMIKKEKQAVYDSGLNSWMAWNASNRYTEGAYR